MVWRHRGASRTRRRLEGVRCRMQAHSFPDGVSISRSSWSPSWRSVGDGVKTMLSAVSVALTIGAHARTDKSLLMLSSVHPGGDSAAKRRTAIRRQASRCRRRAPGARGVDRAAVRLGSLDGQSVAAASFRQTCTRDSRAPVGSVPLQVTPHCSSPDNSDAGVSSGDPFRAPTSPRGRPGTEPLFVRAQRHLKEPPEALFRPRKREGDPRIQKAPTCTVGSNSRSHCLLDGRVFRNAAGGHRILTQAATLLESPQGVDHDAAVSGATVFGCAAAISSSVLLRFNRLIRRGSCR